MDKRFTIIVGGKDMIASITDINWETDNEYLLDSLPTSMEHELEHGDDIYAYGQDAYSIFEEIEEYLTDCYGKVKSFEFSVDNATKI